MDHKVIPKVGSNRFVIADKDGKIVNDAQGYGYTSKNAAIKAMWYHFGGGKKKIMSAEKEAKDFWKAHKEVAKDLNNLYETWFKEIAFGGIEEKELVEEVCKKYSIKDIPMKYIDYLPD